MLNLLPETLRDCERISRRSLLQIGSLAGLGVSLPGLLAQKAHAKATGAKSKKETSCILIWTRGGTSHHDTFDPKPDAPANVRGEFGTIETAIPGVRFTEIVPRMAKELKPLKLEREFMQVDRMRHGSTSSRSSTSWPGLAGPSASRAS